MLVSSFHDSNLKPGRVSPVVWSLNVTRFSAIVSCSSAKSSSVGRFRTRGIKHLVGWCPGMSRVISLYWIPNISGSVIVIQHLSLATLCNIMHYVFVMSRCKCRESPSPLARCPLARAGHRLAVSPCWARHAPPFDSQTRAEQSARSSPQIKNRSCGLFFICGDAGNRTRVQTGSVERIYGDSQL